MLMMRLLTVLKLKHRHCRRLCLKIVVITCTCQLFFILLLYSDLNFGRDNNGNEAEYSSGINLLKNETNSRNKSSLNFAKNVTKGFDDAKLYKNVDTIIHSASYVGSVKEVLKQRKTGNETGQVNKQLRDFKMRAIEGQGQPGDVKVGKNQINYTGMYTQAGWPCVGEEINDPITFRSLTQTLHVFSVFWDARMNDFDNNDHQAKLRIFMLASMKDYKNKTSVYCQFSFQERNITTKTTYYEMCENHKKAHGGYILSCGVPAVILQSLNNHQHLCSVRLSTDEFQPGKKFKVYTTHPQETQTGFTVCVSPMFGDLNLENLLEWFELQRILGVDHVIMYELFVSKKTMEFLNRYKSLGRITVIPWNIPITNNKTIHYNGQSIAIMDCLYRTMAVNEYTIFNDIDEVIIPYKDHNLPALVQRIDHDPQKTCAFQIQSAIFLTALSKTRSLVKNIGDLMTVKNNFRTNISPKLTKCILKPRLIFEAGIHHVSKPVKATLKPVQISLPLALLHHYRKCKAAYGIKCNNKYTEENIVRSNYSDELLRRVQEMRGLLR